MEGVMQRGREGDRKEGVRARESVRATSKGAR